LNDYQLLHRKTVYVKWRIRGGEPGTVAASQRAPYDLGGNRPHTDLRLFVL